MTTKILSFLQENKIMEMKQQIRAMEGELTNVVKEQAEFTVQMNDAKVFETRGRSHNPYVLNCETGYGSFSYVFALRFCIG
jgi:hypothetical protein